MRKNIKFLVCFLIVLTAVICLSTTCQVANAASANDLVFKSVSWPRYAHEYQGFEYFLINDVGGKPIVVLNSTDFNITVPIATQADEEFYFAYRKNDGSAFEATIPRVSNKEFQKEFWDDYDGYWYTTNIYCFSFDMSVLGPGKYDVSLTVDYMVWTIQSSYTIYYYPTYSINYNLNGGTLEQGSPSTHTYNTETSLLSPTRTGFTFGGWYLNSDFSGQAVTALAATGYTSNISLFAKWEATPVSVSWPVSISNGTFNTLYTSSNAITAACATGGMIVFSGDIPNGLVMNSSTGIITGKPSDSYPEGTTITIHATNSSSGAVSSKTYTIIILKATPSVTSSQSVSAYYGQTLAQIFQNGWSSNYNDWISTFGGEDVDGTWSWTSSSSAVGNVGLRTHTAIFTPTNSNYNTLSGIVVPIAVEKATPAVATPTNLSANYGQLLSNVLSNGWSTNTSDWTSVNPNSAASVSGTWAWKTATSAVGNVGSNKHIAVFTPTSSGNYNTSEIEVLVTVAKATPTVTVPSSVSAVYGQTLAQALADGWNTNANSWTSKNPYSAADVAGTWAWTTSTVAVGNAGTNTHSAVFTPTDTANYNSVSSVNVSVAVSKATPSASGQAAADITYGDTLALSAVTATVSGVTGENNLNGAWAWILPDTKPNAGTHSTYQAKFTPVSTNYNAITVYVTIKVLTKVTFNSNGAVPSVIDSQSIAIGGKVGNPIEVTKTALDFAGWYSDSSFSTQWSFSSSTIPVGTNTLTLYAKWNATVTFHSEGGTAVAGQIVAEGGRATHPSADPSRTGYVFVNWYQSNKSTVFSFSSTITKHTEVYAIWKDVEAPTIAFFNEQNQAILDAGTTRIFRAEAFDTGSGVEEFYYRIFGSATWILYDGAELTQNLTKYELRAVDAEGNETILTMILHNVETFENQKAIYDSYKVTSWYRVTLPSRIFNITGKDISGSYTFESYEAALNFAIQKETEYRCSAIANGWIYVSTTNEAVSQVYTDKSVLDTAILKYAKSYISQEQRLSSTASNNYYTPVNNQAQVNSSALTRNEMQIPAFLATYHGLNAYLCSDLFRFTQAKFSYGNFAVQVKLTYIGTDVNLVSPKQILATYDTSVKSILSAANNYLQGYYLVTEYDAIGNVEEYLIYIDIEKPSFSGAVQYGDGTNEEILFNFDYVSQRVGTMYFISLSFNALFDNADEDFLCVFISGRGFSQIYLAGEILPILDNSFGPGKYTIQIYDRSFNILEFEVVIAGAEPAWTYTSLSNETRLQITATTASDSNNAITDLKLFKIQSDGTYIRIEYDDDGKKVDFTSLTYVLRSGGKYTMQLTDLFGRTIEMTPIFYLKDLPIGVLNGVKDGGRTKSEVTFKYSNGNTLIVYIYINNVKTVFDDYSTVYQNNSDTYLITFEATAETSFEYLLFLYKSDDIGLFVEYCFEIDCIIGEVVIRNEQGNFVDYDGATTSSFALSWQDDLTVRYYTASTVGGSLNSLAYKKNTFLATENLYYFTVTDDVGNNFSFTVYLKTKVAYTISGSYVTLQDRIASNQQLVVTVLDAYTSFYVSNSDGHTFDNATPIVNEGIYVLTVVDVYGLCLELTIEINRQLPKLELSGVEANGSTNSQVTISFEEGVSTAYLTNEKGTVIRQITNHEAFSQHGIYYIKIVDYIGNVTETSFSIVLFIEYQSSCINGQIATSKVDFKFLVPLKKIEMLCDGELIEHKESFTDVGKYTIFATDSVGNTLEFCFEIIPSRHQEFVRSLPESFAVSGLSLNGQSIAALYDQDGNLYLSQSGSYTIELTNTASNEKFLLSIEVDNIPPTATLEQQFGSSGYVKIASTSKTNVSFILIKDGIVVDYSGKAITEVGKYVLIVQDDLGNLSTYEFEIKFVLNTWSIVLIVVGSLLGLLSIFLTVRSRMKFKVK